MALRQLPVGHPPALLPGMIYRKVFRVPKEKNGFVVKACFQETFQETQKNENNGFQAVLLYIDWKSKNKAISKTDMQTGKKHKNIFLVLCSFFSFDKVRCIFVLTVKILHLL
jgi:hypothetical protein